MTPRRDVPSAEAMALAGRLGITATAAGILVSRGLTDVVEVGRYFEPRLSHLTPPVTMRDRAEASSRIARAVRARETICVFGDYDADGITSTAILCDALRALGGNVVPVLAERFAGGCGLSDPALLRVLSTGATLLVTCDCGSSDHERLESARRQGLDVVVIDHHRVPEEPLPALAFLNPHRPDCAFPYKGLASCGLALTLVGAIRQELGISLDLRLLLDLVALGTIADVAPLDGDNRALVRAGLATLASSPRPGIRALLEMARHAAGECLTGEDVAFRLAPRINAPGRLASPALALRLLLARSDGEARTLALEIDAISEERKRLDRALLVEANAMLEDPALGSLPVVVLGKEGWHQGVVGIVAGRIAARTGKPTVIIGFTGGEGRGSVRGPKGAPLYDMLTAAKGGLLGFGGHQAAAGVHLRSNQLDTFRELFADACVRHGVTAKAAEGMPHHDGWLAPGDRPWDVVENLARFEPCGQGNTAPVLAIGPVTVARAREVRGGHLKLDLVTAAGPLSGFAFDMGPRGPELEAARTVVVFGKLRKDAYRGGSAVEVRVDAVVTEASLAGA